MSRLSGSTESQGRIEVVRTIALETISLADQARRHGLVQMAERLIEVAFAVLDEATCETA
jgi:hypothetical protein